VSMGVPECACQFGYFLVAGRCGACPLLRTSATPLKASLERLMNRWIEADQLSALPCAHAPRLPHSRAAPRASTDLGKTDAPGGAQAVSSNVHLGAPKTQRVGATDDKLGRLTKGGTRSYNWNIADQLETVSNTDGSRVENRFDSKGIRRFRTETDASGTASTVLFISPWSEVRDGKLQRYIVYGGRSGLLEAPSLDIGYRSTSSGAGF